MLTIKKDQINSTNFSQNPQLQTNPQNLHLQTQIHHKPNANFPGPPLSPEKPPIAHGWLEQEWLCKSGYSVGEDQFYFFKFIFQIWDHKPNIRNEEKQI